MLGRIPGSTCAHRNLDHFGRNPPPRNPGPLGYNDAADPNLPGALGNTPGSLGDTDYAAQASHQYPIWLANRRAELPQLSKQAPFDLDKLCEQLGIPANKWEAYYPKLESAVAVARDLVTNFADLPDVIQRVVVDIAFVLGRAAFAESKRLIEAFEAKDYPRAAREMLKTTWPARASRRAPALLQLVQNWPARVPLPDLKEINVRPLVKRDVPTAAVVTPPLATGFGTTAG